jgi:hypothetical protein
MNNDEKNRGIYHEDDDDKKNIKKKPGKITDPLEDEAQQDDTNSRDLDTPQKQGKPKE